IADELKHQFEISLDKKKIHLEHPIRTLGDFEVELRLHQDVVTTLKVKVESSTPLPPAPPPAEVRGREGRPGRGDRGPAKEGETPPQKTEKRGRRPEAKAEAAEKPAKAEKTEKPGKSDKGQKPS